MPEDRVARRLAAILVADVVGYSRLMGADELDTLARLKELRNGLLHPSVQAHGGRIVKTSGDGTLIEFASAVDAVQHAVEVQTELAARNRDLPPSRRIEFRMGINVGDIIVDEDDIFGDGVNVAARLETLAAAGGICLSGTVFDQIRGKLDLPLDDLGPQSVKNIAEPIRVYQMRLDGGTSVVSAAPVSDSPALPEKPSIAVLPFTAMGSGHEHEEFADGMTEDLITDQSKISGLFVVARNSSFAFRGQAVDVREIAQRLGVRYVLEGSLRKAGARVRINAQLIDAATGGHIWADRYDGALDDVFELQDEVCAEVVAALSVELRGDERDRLRRVHTNNLEAYELYIRAKATPYPPLPERIRAPGKCSNRSSSWTRISPAAMPGPPGPFPSTPCGPMRKLARWSSAPWLWRNRPSGLTKPLPGRTRPWALPC
jgi:adenylate cyclase